MCVREEHLCVLRKTGAVSHPPDGEAVSSKSEHFCLGDLIQEKQPWKGGEERGEEEKMRDVRKAGRELGKGEG